MLHFRKTAKECRRVPAVWIFFYVRIAIALRMYAVLWSNISSDAHGTVIDNLGNMWRRPPPPTRRADDGSNEYVGGKKNSLQI